MNSSSGKQNKIIEIEQYIDFLSNHISKNVLNISPNEPNLDYNQDRTKIGYEYFIQSGDCNYFVSRFLFLNGIHEYGFFCGQQCIENYLKAYLKFLNKYPKRDFHDLSVLLDHCRKAGNDAFINSARANTIIVRFNPFYELARYPVQNKFRPKGRRYSFLFPDDIYPLDYFVLKMREVLPYPHNKWDVLKTGKPEVITSNTAITFFKEQNINFM